MAGVAHLLELGGCLLLGGSCNSVCHFVRLLREHNRGVIVSEFEVGYIIIIVLIKTNQCFPIRMDSYLSKQLIKIYRFFSSILFLASP